MMTNKNKIAKQNFHELLDKAISLPSKPQKQKSGDYSGKKENPSLKDN